MEKICPKNKDGAPNKHLLFLTMNSATMKQYMVPLRIVK